MGYKITEQAQVSPGLFPNPNNPKEFIGVGGAYEVNSGSSCASCSKEEKAALAKKSAGKEKRSFREAEPHEYEALARQYKAGGGIPNLLIYVPDEPKPQVQPKGLAIIEKE